MTERRASLPDDEEELVLSELLNHVLDKGVVIAGDVTISIGGIDLVRLGLTLALSSVESEEARRLGRAAPPPLAPPDEA